MKTLVTFFSLAVMLGAVACGGKASTDAAPPPSAPVVTAVPTKAQLTKAKLDAAVLSLPDLTVGWSVPLNPDETRYIDTCGPEETAHAFYSRIRDFGFVIQTSAICSKFSAADFYKSFYADKGASAVSFPKFGDESFTMRIQGAIALEYFVVMRHGPVITFLALEGISDSESVTIAKAADAKLSALVSSKGVQ